MTRISWLSFAAILLLLPVGRTAELALVVCVVAALGAWARGAAPSWRGAHARLLLALFAAYWLPSLCSAWDSVQPEQSWRTTAGALRFGLLALVPLLWAERRTELLPRLQNACAWIAGLWALDALVQAATGLSAGGWAHGERISGVFGADNLKLGPVLAVLSPFLLRAAYGRWGAVGGWAAWLLSASAILLAGTRAGWVSFALVTAVVPLWLHASWRARCAAFLTCALAAMLATVALVQFHAGFAQRVQRTADLLHTDYAHVDRALAGRLPIWRTSLRMALDHPVNGVGVRAFRYAYARYAGAADPWVDARTGQGASHPHQLLLEIASETGLLGVLLWLAGVAAAWRAWHRASAAGRQMALAPALALLAMTFPVNTHFAFYSSFWGLLFWWLLAQYAAAVTLPGECAAGKLSASAPGSTAPGAST